MKYSASAFWEMCSLISPLRRLIWYSLVAVQLPSYIQLVGLGGGGGNKKQTATDEDGDKRAAQRWPGCVQALFSIVGA